MSDQRHAHDRVADDAGSAEANDLRRNVDAGRHERNGGRIEREIMPDVARVRIADRWARGTPLPLVDRDLAPLGWMPSAWPAVSSQRRLSTANVFDGRIGAAITFDDGMSRIPLRDLDHKTPSGESPVTKPGDVPSVRQCSANPAFFRFLTRIEEELAAAREDRLLTMQGQAVDVLGGDQVGQQPRRGIAARQDLRRHRRDFDALVTTRAGVFWAYVTDDLELRCWRLGRFVRI